MRDHDGKIRRVEDRCEPSRPGADERPCRIRECTPAQLAEAQAKFNVLSHDSQRDARQELTSAKKKARNQAASCSTCPVAQAAARNAAAAAKKAYTEQSKALRQKQQTLATEALEWAAGQASPSTAAK